MTGKNIYTRNRLVASLGVVICLSWGGYATFLFSKERPSISRDVSVQIEDASAFPKLTCVIHNRSDKPQRLWESWNSWGFFNLSFCILSNDASIYKINATQNVEWTKNFPSYVTLPPKGKLTIKVNLSDEKKWNIPNDYQPSKANYVCAIYAVDVTDESVENHVLTGISVSSWVSTTSPITHSPEPAEDEKYDLLAKDNMERICKAIYEYTKEHHEYPPAYSIDADGKPLLSWRVLILPYLSEKGKVLYKQFHLDEPWHSEHNSSICFLKMPLEYRSPYSALWKSNKTNYLTVRGKNTLFPGDKGLKISDIRDGTRNTIMLVEVSDSRAVHWASPEDYTFDEKAPSNGLGLRPDGFLAGMADDSVHFFKLPIDHETIIALFTPRGGEHLSWPSENTPIIEK